MHRAIGYLSKRFVQIRPQEGRKVILTFLFFFLVITAYYLIKPASRSLVLGGLGSRMVPYIDLIVAAVMGPFVTLFARLVDRMEKGRLVSLSFWCTIGILVLFWRLLSSPASWIAGAFYLWVAIFSVLVVTLFWLVANDLYQPREAKRLFGFIGSGGILGGIVGSSIAAVCAQVIGTRHLPLLSAGLLVVCWFVVQELWKLAPDRAEEAAPAAAPRRKTFLSDMRGFARLLLESRYLLLLISLVAVNKVIATLIYYQLNPFIEQTFLDQDARTTFTSLFFGGMNVLSFVIQFFLTSWVLRRAGLGVALLALPAGLLLGTGAMLFAPVFWLAALTELYDGAMNYSLQQTTKEVLYLPIDRSIRYKVKPFIDMVVFRFGKGVAAVIGIVLLDVLHLPPRVLTYVIVPLVLAWLVAAWWLRRDYVSAIRTILQARAEARRAGSLPSGAPAEAGGRGNGGPAAMEPAAALLNGALPARKLALLDHLVEASGAMSAPAKKLVEELASYELPLESLAEPDVASARLKLVISDPTEPMARRRHAVRTLGRAGDQAAVDYLVGMVLIGGDSALRQEAVRGLIRLRLERPQLEFPVATLRRQIAYEVQHSQRIVRIGGIYRHHHRGPLPEDDAVWSLLRVLLEESTEQIFRLLMLLHRPDDIRLVYEQLRVPDRYVRADAIELLDNLIDPAMRGILGPILDEDEFLGVLDEGPAREQDPVLASQVLQSAIWDHDSWLSVTTLCAAGRLRLPAMRQELERAARHATPLIANAAKLALQLSTPA